MELFWLKGYSNTSLEELVSRTGASRYGLYATFRDKHDLFMQALNHYSRRTVDPTIGGLDHPLASSTEIRAFFDRVFQLIRPPQGRRGCLLCNTGVELGPFDAAAAKEVRRFFRRLRRLFGLALANARRDGTLARGTNVRAYADSLVGAVAGTFLLARSGMPMKMIRRYVDTSLRSLR